MGVPAPTMFRGLMWVMGDVMGVECGTGGPGNEVDGVVRIEEFEFELPPARLTALKNGELEE